jgi:phytoene dehydrogenase-like protein
VPEALDVVVIGSGPNGLGAAAVLARAGLAVRVVEASDQFGGATQTRELTLPGFHHDVCSAVHPMGALSPLFRSLPLAEHGLRWIHPPISAAHPLDDGPAALLARSFDTTCETLGEDGRAWRALFEYLSADPETLFYDVLGPLRVPRGPLRFARFGMLAFRSARGLARARFRGERARALFAGCAGHSVLPLDFWFTAALGLVFAVSGHAIDWPVAQGGSQAIARALCGYLTSLGVELTPSTHVRSLAQLPKARAYVFDTAPRQLGEIARDALPARYLRRLARYVYGPAVFKLDFALSGPIPWKDPRCGEASTVHVGGTLDEIHASERAAWRGEHAERPFVMVTQQSHFDASRAPPGKHTGYAYCHVPFASTVDMTERVEAQIERFAPGFRDLILARHVLMPRDLEARNPSLVGGVITGGAAHLPQLFTRPVARLDPYSTPNPSIFVCSGSAPPGGGVHGMGGYWAARSVLRRLGVANRLAL